jgi:hypothetical protein
VNDRQRQLKRQYKFEGQSKLTDPIIDCLGCNHLECNEEPGQKLFWCKDPAAITLRGRVLHKSVGAESLDLINAPKECMKREPCDHPGCQSHVSHPCEGCNRMWGQS